MRRPRPTRACHTKNKQIKPPGHKAGNSHRSTAKVRNGWSHTSAPLICFHGVDGTFVLSFYCVCVCVYIYIYIYIHTYTHTHTQIRMDCTSLRIMKRQCPKSGLRNMSLVFTKHTHIHIDTNPQFVCSTAG